LGKIFIFLKNDDDHEAVSNFTCKWEKVLNEF